MKEQDNEKTVKADLRGWNGKNSFELGEMSTTVKSVGSPFDKILDGFLDRDDSPQKVSVDSDKKERPHSRHHGSRHETGPHGGWNS